MLALYILSNVIFHILREYNHVIYIDIVWMISGAFFKPKGKSKEFVLPISYRKSDFFFIFFCKKALMNFWLQIESCKEVWKNCSNIKYGVFIIDSFWVQIFFFPISLLVLSFFVDNPQRIIVRGYSLAIDTF